MGGAGDGPFVNVAVIDAYLAEEIARIENPPTKRVDFPFVRVAKEVEAAAVAEAKAVKDVEPVEAVEAAPR